MANNLLRSSQFDLVLIKFMHVWQDKYDINFFDVVQI